MKRKLLLIILIVSLLSFQKVSFGQAPNITTEPSNQTACTGDSVHFSVTATGTGLTYQWRKGTSNLINGGTISGADAATLRINPHSFSDTASDYNVVVSGTYSPTATSNNTSLIDNTIGSINPISGATAICESTTTNYTLTTVVNASSYIWNNSNLTGSTITSGQGTTAIALTVGAVSGYLVVQAYCSDCNTYSSKDSVYISVVQNVYGNGQWIGGVSSDWFDVDNWCGSIPSSTVSAYIDGSYPATPNYFPVINAAGATTFDFTLEGDYDTLTIIGSNNLDVYGSWINGQNSSYNGHQSSFISNNSTVTFKGNTNYQTINGLLPTTFHNLIINRGTSITDTLENVYRVPISMTGNLNIVNGLFIISEPNSIVQFTTAPTIPSTAGLELNGGVLASGNYNITNNGTFRMTEVSSDITIGTASGNSIITSGSSALLEILGGNLTVASQLVVSNDATFNFNDSISITAPNSITLNSVGTTSNSLGVFDIDASSNMEISGNMVFHKANAGTGKDVKIISSVNKYIDGRAFQFGDATTPANQTFRVMDSLIAFYDITINAQNTPIVILDAPVFLLDILNLTSGVLKLNRHLLTIYYNQPGAIINNYISAPFGYILAEDSVNLAAIKWNILSNHQIYTFPFGNKYGCYIPFKFTNVSGPDDYVTIATYAPSDDTIAHLPYAPTVAQIGADSSRNYVNDSASMVNRFWQIDVTPQSSGTTNANITFTYAPNEMHNSNASMVGQRWNTAINGWEAPYNCGSQSSNSSLRTVTVTGVTHFSPWTLAQASQPLPIELLSFSATNENDKFVKTNWTTASEINNSHFEVEHSKDGINFESFGKVAGAGNSNTLLNYSLVDQSPYPGISYYKLKQVDFDGKFSYSKIVSIEFNPAKNVSIYPNPNNGNFFISYNFSAAGSNTSTNPDASIHILDGTGTIVYSYTLQNSEGIETIATQLNNGIYYWELISGSQVLDKSKIIVMR